MVVHSLKVLALSYLFCSLLHISFADTVDPCVGEHFCARQPEIAKIVLWLQWHCAQYGFWLSAFVKCRQLCNYGSVGAGLDAGLRKHLILKILIKPRTAISDVIFDNGMIGMPGYCRDIVRCWPYLRGSTFCRCKRMSTHNYLPKVLLFINRINTHRSRILPIERLTSSASKSRTQWHYAAQVARCQSVSTRHLLLCGRPLSHSGPVAALLKGEASV